MAVSNQVTGDLMAGLDAILKAARAGTLVVNKATAPILRTFVESANVLVEAAESVGTAMAMNATVRDKIWNYVESMQKHLSILSALANVLETRASLNEREGVLVRDKMVASMEAIAKLTASLVEVEDNLDTRQITEACRSCAQSAKALTAAAVNSFPEHQLLDRARVFSSTIFHVCQAATKVAEKQSSNYPERSSIVKDICNDVKVVSPLVVRACQAAHRVRSKENLDTLRQITKRLARLLQELATPLNVPLTRSKETTGPLPTIAPPAKTPRSRALLAAIAEKDDTPSPADGSSEQPTTTGGDADPLPPTSEALPPPPTSEALPPPPTSDAPPSPPTSDAPPSPPTSDATPAATEVEGASPPVPPTRKEESSPGGDGALEESVSPSSPEGHQGARLSFAGAPQTPDQIQEYKEFMKNKYADQAKEAKASEEEAETQEDPSKHEAPSSGWVRRPARKLTTTRVVAGSMRRSRRRMDTPDGIYRELHVPIPVSAKEDARKMKQRRGTIKSSDEGLAVLRRARSVTVSAELMNELEIGAIMKDTVPEPVQPGDYEALKEDMKVLREENARLAKQIAQMKALMERQMQMLKDGLAQIE